MMQKLRVNSIAIPKTFGTMRARLCPVNCRGPNLCAHCTTIVGLDMTGPGSLRYGRHMPKLVINGTAHELIEDLITIGRGADNMIVINDPSVSTHHAELQRAGETYQLKDLGFDQWHAGQWYPSRGNGAAHRRSDSIWRRRSPLRTGHQRVATAASA